MNDEIKEILDRFEKLNVNILYPFEMEASDCKKLLDYITNLEQENERLKEENKQLRNCRKYDLNLISNLKHDKVRYEEIIENLTTMTVCNDRKQIKNTAQYKLEDYKSRCEKAIEYINIFKNDIRGIDEIVLLNILQNGGDKNV